MMPYANPAVTDRDGNLRLDSGAGVMVGDQRVLAGRQSAIYSPSGGEVADGEARAAINQIIAALMAHGLIE